MTLEPMTILMAEDDPDDRALARDALHECGPAFELRTVCDGEELLEYLRHEGRYASPAEAPYPTVVLLDMNMPRMDGREVLAEMKADEALRRIPIVVLSTSQATEDVIRSYDLGASGYIGKPNTFVGLVNVFYALEQWLAVVTQAPPWLTNMRSVTDGLAPSSEFARLPRGPLAGAQK
ncbi:MAG: response regulator [bacterium]